ncbi:arylsulfatase, partial [bacterium]|nr:arylsulfatase [bacterium]
SGMYVQWMGKKMWAFGPAKTIVQQHMATFQQWPVPTAKDSSDSKLQGGVGQ